LGNVTATFLQVLVSVVGLGALLVASETAFKLLNGLGILCTWALAYFAHQENPQ